MAELELHHAEEHSDPLGQRVGLLAAVLAVLLAIVTISSHRSHTAAVMRKSEVNDQWSFYQSKRIKAHNLELGLDLLTALAPSKGAETQKMLERYQSEKARYESEAEEIRKEAVSNNTQVERIEERALRFDLGEGLIEIALVLSSLYFISRKKLFPVIGILAGALGVVVAVTGYLH